MHAISPKLLAVCLLTLSTVISPVCVFGDAVYKSIDAQGRVTYSSQPPPTGSAKQVEEVQIQPGPTSADADAAVQRLRALEQASQNRESEQAAAANERGSAIATAQNELIRAKAELEQAKIQADGDWQYLVRGGRVLSESYFQRVAEAEARVEAAEKSLERARQGR